MFRFTFELKVDRLSSGPWWKLRGDKGQWREENFLTLVERIHDLKAEFSPWSIPLFLTRALRDKITKGGKKTNPKERGKSGKKESFGFGPC